MSPPTVKRQEFRLGINIDAPEGTDPKALISMINNALNCCPELFEMWEKHNSIPAFTVYERKEDY